MLQFFLGFFFSFGEPYLFLLFLVSSHDALKIVKLKFVTSSKLVNPLLVAIMLVVSRPIHNLIF